MAAKYWHLFSHFFREVGLEVVPHLIGSGLVLPRYHLVLGEHLTFPHSSSCCHPLFLDACWDSAVIKGDLESIEAGEVGRDAHCWIPCLAVPLGFAVVLLEGRLLNSCLIVQMFDHQVKVASPKLMYCFLRGASASRQSTMVGWGGGWWWLTRHGG